MNGVRQSQLSEVCLRLAAVCGVPCVVIDVLARNRSGEENAEKRRDGSPCTPHGNDDPCEYNVGIGRHDLLRNV